MDQLGHKTLFTYDANNRLGSTTDPIGDKDTFIRDAVGRPSRIVRSKGHIDFTYDADGRMSTKSYNGGVVSTYSYDAVGNLTGVVDSQQKTGLVYQYDAANRIAQITYTDGLQWSVGYNGVGNPETVQYPGLTVNYQYDNRNRISHVEWVHGLLEGWCNFTYDGSGNLLTENRSNTTSSIYAYDGNNRVIEITHLKDVNIVAHMKYTRDAVGNIIEEDVTAPVKAALYPLAEQTVYNAANQIVSSGTDKYTYEPNGNLTKIAGHQVFQAAYDLENRPVSITRNGTTSTYTYDGNGNRVKSVTGSDITNAHYDMAGRLMFETDKNGNVTACYIYQGSRLVAMRTSEDDHYFYHFDKTGDTVYMTDRLGATVNAYAYSPFGEILNSTVTVPNPFTYVGAYGTIDDGDGLYFMKNRYYDSIQGTFFQKDPIGVTGGQTNLYNYVGNNPVTRIDPGEKTGKQALLPEQEPPLGPLSWELPWGGGLPLWLEPLMAQRWPPPTCMNWLRKPLRKPAGT